VARIFLCHASEDKAQVREVYHRLRAIDGFEPWLDEEDLLPGQDWAREIPRALQTSDFILIFLSRRSVAKRGYVQREMKLALDAWQELPEGTIHTIPVRIDECNVPESFQRYHWANLFEPNGFARIVRAIRVELAKQLGTAPPPLPPPPPNTRLSEGPTTTDNTLESTFTNSIGMEFVLIPAGTFMMGSPDSEAEADDDEKPAHCVTISQPFYLGKYPVTQAQWEAMMGNNPSHFSGHPTWPVDGVSWNDAHAFLRKLDEREGGRDYRLPTEAQWEYACRAGTETPRYHPDVNAIAWYRENSNGHPQPVGQKLPNAWGVYDMLGNVWEWCQDGKRSYTADTTVDPIELTGAGSAHVFRGGSWRDAVRYVRATNRLSYAPHFRHDLLGFRCARSARRR
jgi:formylglycine-generating enzyme required for sulfatase activity